MVISKQMLEKLRKVLEDQNLETKDDEVAAEQATNVLRFVLCKEREAMKSMSKQGKAND